MNTIEAKLVAEGVGLPPVSSATSTGGTGCWHDARDGLPDGDTLDLSDPQTAFGVALKLDEWERHTPEQKFDHWQNSPHRHYWVRALGEAFTESNPDVREERLAGLLVGTVARLTYIGQDHAIRRALGWTVEPGTLAMAFQNNVLDWVVMCPTTAAQARFRLEAYPILVDIRDKGAAGVAIYGEMCA